jgi:hypothetical protein
VADEVLGEALGKGASGQCALPHAGRVVARV